MAPETPGATPPAGSPLDQALTEVNEGRPQAAISMLKLFKPTMDEFADYNYVYAQALRGAKKLYDSLEFYRLAYIYFPAGRKKELSLLERGEVYEDLGFNQEAASIFRIFLKTFKKSEFSEKAHLELANVLFRTVHYKEALANYEKAGNSAEALYGKAEALFAAGKAKEAYDLFGSLAASGAGKNFSATPLARYSQGEACRLLGKLDEAKAHLGSIKEGELSHRAFFSLGLIAMQEKGFSDAAVLFRKAAGSTRAGLKYKALLNLAQCDLELGRTDDAIESLKQITQNLFHGEAVNEALLLLARATAKKGRAVDAVNILKPLLIKKDYALQAVDELQKIMEEEMANDPAKFPVLWKLAGDALTQPARAAFIFKAAGQLEASDLERSMGLYAWLVRNGSPVLKMEAARKLTGYYVARGNGKEAWNFFKIAKLAGHDDPSLRLKAGVYFLIGHYPAAQTALLSVKEPSQDDLLLLARIIPHIRNVRSIGLIEKRIRNREVPAMLYVSLADSEYARGLKVQALELYKQAYKEAAPAPGHLGLTAADVKWTLFRMQSLEKDPEEALGSLQSDGGIMGRYAAARLLETKVSQER
ncbi:MAG: tetratricopeptide repeat protein [Nitrospiraceae bacterium]|nr:tetratricopeptide repeat protein [Nitrospiraceae bacterium]